MEGIYTGTIAEGFSTTMYNGTQSYDKNGNIGYLKRTTGGGATVMDELIYSYTANQLTAVADGGDATKGFKDKINAIDYTYDQAGNMITDANKDLSIAYNHLNLPASITRNTPVGSSTPIPNGNSGAGATAGLENNGIVKHYYAGATKVRMETYDATGTTLVKAYDYLAGMVYQETVTAGTSTKELDFVASSEGRALLTKKVLNLTADPTTGDKFRFEYSLKDHLGNLRVSCRCGEPKRDAQGIIIPEGTAGAGIETLAVVQEQHYDAWGLAFSSVSSSVAENKKDRFTYNGKELVTNLDLGRNNYGFRMFDASLGRWIAVDALSENYEFLSGYNYTYNNPVNFKDILGLAPGDPKTGADGLTNDQWLNSSNPLNYDKNFTMANSFRNDNRIASTYNFYQFRNRSHFDSDDFSFQFPMVGDGDQTMVNVYPYVFVMRKPGNFKWAELDAPVGFAGLAYDGLESIYHIPNVGWRGVNGKWHSYSSLDQGLNGKYVRGVQGLRISKAAAIKATKLVGAAGKVLGGVGIGLTVLQRANNEISNLEASVDGVMGIIGFFPPWGTLASSVYFVGKLAIESYNDKPIFEKPKQYD